MGVSGRERGGRKGMVREVRGAMGGKKMGE